MQNKTTQPCSAQPTAWPRNDDRSLIDDVTYDARTDETVVTLSDTTVGHGLAVVELVSEREDCCATELTPLYDAVDPENLDRIFDERPGGSEIVVSFEYEGYDVTVTADTVAVSPL